ncbi:hypothetical protein BJ878DRAFT_277429 [Calycina marina]|uniref:Wax synthase domain-containing protein n=1 Tax=Calycina marina TaxID=1763456 RepID=A0A9P7YVV7_9HELO|nr:hypothetical protein BJ878DRAFT_277429 [Calycina marina]
MELLNIAHTVSWFSLSMFSGIVGINSPQKYRPYILIPVISFAVLAFRKISDSNFGIEGTESVAMFIAIYISHITTVLCVEQYHLPTKPGVTFNFVGGYKMLFNCRWLGTSRQAPDIHRDQLVATKEEEELNGEPATITSSSLALEVVRQLHSILRTPRAVFLRNKALSLLTIYMINQVYWYGMFELLHSLDMGLEGTDFLPSKVSYFRRIHTVTLRETLVRVWLVCYWTFYSVGLYTGFHDVLAMFFVGIGLDTPQEWPPLFGSIKQATSIRGFWGKYWHRLVYRSYTSYGVFISKHILCLPRDSFVGKMFISLYVFVMSGTAHSIAVRQLGFTCGFWEEIVFYSCGFVGILLETMAMAAFKRLSGGYKVNKQVGNIIGYMWVFMYLFTTVPKSQYPKLWCQPA